MATLCVCVCEREREREKEKEKEKERERERERCRVMCARYSPPEKASPPFSEHHLGIDVRVASAMAGAEAPRVCWYFQQIHTHTRILMDADTHYHLLFGLEVTDSSEMDHCPIPLRKASKSFLQH